MTRRAWGTLGLLLILSATTLAQHSQILWQRTSPSPKHIDGPVLYQIIFRSSATPGHVPIISPTFTLANSPISVTGSSVNVGGLSIDNSSGLLTFASGQTFPGAGTVTSVVAGTGLTGGTISTSGTIALDTSFTDARYEQIGTSRSILSAVCTQVGLQTSGSPVFMPGLGTASNSCGSGNILTFKGLPMPSGGTLQNLQFVATVNPAIGSSLSGVQATLYLNSNPSAMTCTLLPPYGSEQTCSDTTHKVAVNESDTVGIGISGSMVKSSDALGDVRVSIEKAQ